MSLIEKAVNKLAGETAPAASQEDDSQHTAAPAAKRDLIAQAMAKQTSSGTPGREPARSAAPVTAQSVMVNLARLKSAGFVTPDAERTEIAEEFRLIKRPLLINATGQGGEAVPRGNMILVTSSLPGEGKTFCAINLAISIAMEMDRTVLLVDADVAKPKLMQYLGVPGEKDGLLDVLRSDGLALPDVLLKTNIEKLTLLPAGKPYKHATELLASEAMNRLVDDMANRYSDRIVIFDSPPLLATSEASVLASHMGQIVMVVEADHTPQSALREALELIEDSGAAISLLLNKTTGPQSAGGYYGYGYGYGKYGT
ncbi:XrtA-associated tyrosine autokinase [Thiobacter aerophilum]|uniref:non-specific protein-tyrosine kinase n=1 Tax=Thiobacter aerophilum TaxID=3121275 RepID=A0ABV0EDI4_9BURK